MESLRKLKVGVLKDELRARGADSRGSKATLVVRLKEILDGDCVEIEDFVIGKLAEDQTDSVSGDTKVPSPDPKVPSPDSKVPSPDSKVPSPDPKVPSPDPKVPSRDPKVPSSDPTPDGDNLSRGPRSRVSSVGSRRSGSSVSMSSLLAAESARKAGLKAKVEFLETKRRLELEELDLRMRREDCELRSEIAEAEAKERVLAEHINSSGSGEQGSNVLSAGPIPARPDVSREAESFSGRQRSSQADMTSAQDGPRTQPPQSQPAEADHRSSISRGPLRTAEGKIQRAQTQPPQFHPLQCDPRSSVSRDPLHAAEGRTQRATETGSANPDMSNAFMSQLQRGQLPSPAIPVFNGDVTKYSNLVTSN